tara:strand:- start:2375 stop:2542 length:168 start_codon:yes stop_codon:yes gene_type:complete
MRTKYRVTTCKASGSIWVDDYDTLAEILVNLDSLMDKHPHVIISRQRVKEDGQES